MIRIVPKCKDQTLLFSVLSQLTYWLPVCNYYLLCVQRGRMQLEDVRGKGSARDCRIKNLNYHKSIVGPIGTLNMSLTMF